jgi:hypothetical protein
LANRIGNERFYVQSPNLGLWRDAMARSIIQVPLSGPKRTFPEMA